MTTKTYSPKDITVIIAAHELGGFADGTFVEVEAMTDGVSSVAGADGEVARAMSTDPRCKVTITLLQTSASNDALSTFFDVDQLSGGRGMFPIVIKDNRGTTLMAASQAWVVKKPNSEFSKEVSERKWELETGGGTYHAGGNE